MVCVCFKISGVSKGSTDSGSGEAGDRTFDVQLAWMISTTSPRFSFINYRRCYQNKVRISPIIVMLHIHSRQRLSNMLRMAVDDDQTVKTPRLTNLLICRSHKMKRKGFLMV